MKVLPKRLEEAMAGVEYYITGSAALGIPSKDIDICVRADAGQALQLAGLLQAVGFWECQAYDIPFDWGGHTFLRTRSDPIDGELYDLFCVDEPTYVVIQRTTQALQVLPRALLLDKPTRVRLFQEIAAAWMQTLYPQGRGLVKPAEQEPAEQPAEPAPLVSARSSQLEATCPSCGGEFVVCCQY